MGNELINNNSISDMIITLRDTQIMIDRDLAFLFEIKTKRLNEQVRRNLERFPLEFCFQLTQAEKNELVAKCDRLQTLKHSVSLPYAFTEQGIAMLTTVLKSDTAIKMSIQIINAFVVMRRFISSNASLFNRIEYLERKQIESDAKIDKILDALEDRGIQKNQGVFFEGQFYDAYILLSEIIKSAKSVIRIIDNYIDESILTLLLKREKAVKVCP